MNTKSTDFQSIDIPNLDENHQSRKKQLI